MRRLVLLAVLLGAVVGCVVTGGDVIAADQESNVPEECGTAHVRTMFEGFTQAINLGQREAALAFIAAPPEQNGFSVGSPESQGNLLLSKKPGAIYAFFAREAHSGKHLRLLGGDVKPLDSAALQSGPYRRPSEGPLADDPVAAVAFELKMSGPGDPLLQPSGKAGVNCASGQFYVWALDLGSPVEKGYKGVRVCADKPRVTATKPFKNPVMC